MKAGQAKVRAILVLRFIFNKGMQGLHSKREGEEKQKQLLTHTDSMLLSWTTLPPDYVPNKTHHHLLSPLFMNIWVHSGYPNLSELS
jgi:hypothetical protein